MRILIAPDSFKGSLTSAEAAAAMARGVHSVMPDVETICMPLADGGEGTMDVLQSICIDAIEHEDKTHDEHALIESAKIIGLNLTSMQGDVFGRGSAKLGTALLAALDAGNTDIRVALGGSATVDGGLGLLLALGCRVLDQKGAIVSADLKGLMQARVMDIQRLDPRLKRISLTILSDVQNPLCGVDGAVCMYGSQKGIAAEQLHAVDLAMQNWADLCEDAFGMPVQAGAGTAAAGGLAFALTLLGGRIVSGAEYVMQASSFDQLAATVDWVMTGEGMSDMQTLHGKLPFMVAQAARKAGANVVLISGDVANQVELLDYFDDVIAARPEAIAVLKVMQQADWYLSAAAAKWMRSVLKQDCEMVA